MSTATGRVLLDAEQLGRTLARIGYEIVEKGHRTVVIDGDCRVVLRDVEDWSF